VFTSRIDAGNKLAYELLKRSFKKPVVLGITRGGVVVAAAVARVLKAPLYPLVIKKVSASFNPEFAIGAVGPEGVSVGEFSQEMAQQVADRMKMYGAGDLSKKIKKRTAIIVDDGIATGWTFRAALHYVQGKLPGKIVIAVPVADRGIANKFRKEVDELIVLQEVDDLGAVGNYYEDFSQVSDEEVRALIGGVDRGVKRWKTEVKMKKGGEKLWQR